MAAKRSSRLDSNWVSEIIDTNGKLKPNWREAAHSYWKGIAHPKKPPIWERIVEGAITVWSMDNKQVSLQNIQAMWPQSLNLLRYAISCACYGSFDGEVFPVLLAKENSLHLSYYLRMVHRNNQNHIDSLNKFIAKNPQYSTSISNQGEDRLPDLTQFGRELTISTDSGFGEIVTQVLKTKQG